MFTRSSVLLAGVAPSTQRPSITMASHDPLSSHTYSPSVLVAADSLLILHHGNNIEPAPSQQGCWPSQARCSAEIASPKFSQNIVDLFKSLEIPIEAKIPMEAHINFPLSKEADFTSLPYPQASGIIWWYDPPPIPIASPGIGDVSIGELHRFTTTPHRAYFPKLRTFVCHTEPSGVDGVTRRSSRSPVRPSKLPVSAYTTLKRIHRTKQTAGSAHAVSASSKKKKPRSA